MITPEVAQLVAADRTARFQQAAVSARLAAIARCCRPRHWEEAVRRVDQAATRLRMALRRDRISAVCCAGA